MRAQQWQMLLLLLLLMLAIMLLLMLQLPLRADCMAGYCRGAAAAALQLRMSAANPSLLLHIQPRGSTWF